MHEPFNLGDLGDPATPDGDVALIDCRDWENPRILSHGEFDRQVKACARAIAARGLARGDRVAILSLNRAEGSSLTSPSCAPAWLRFLRTSSFPARPSRSSSKTRRSSLHFAMRLAERYYRRTFPWSTSMPPG